ncbi:MAG TPA: VanW family protein [Armatimonadota bacterium]|jgi:vancomycin resistance protein YoaR
MSARRGGAYRWALAAALAGGVAAVAWLPGGRVEMGGYATSLQGRTRGQRNNALLAARSLDGQVVQPGQTLSFNHAVGSWTPDRGYTLAPVSYSGELVADWGGGVCQTSTTLYNAALVSGMDIVERHRHTWAPNYCSPGRDAAVAQRDIDLRIRNPYPFPVHIRAKLDGDTLGFDFLGGRRGPMAAVEAVGAVTVPSIGVTQASALLPAGSRRVTNPGRPGVRVTAWRVWKLGPRAGQREMMSRDSYPPMNRITLVGTRE